MDTNTKIEITAEVTPNPHTLKFNVNKVFFESGSFNFPDKEKARGNYLPEQLFAIDSVLGVMVGRDFITVTKAPAAQWQTIVGNVTETIKSALASDKELFGHKPQVTEGVPVEGNSAIEQKIRQILDSEIRPAVAMDGGDITFYGYNDGIVTLHLQGSCSSCPSSIMTLKMGVENRLKASIPEVKEVVQV